MLQGYGIPVDLIPMSHTGIVKNTNHILWINALQWKLLNEDEEIVICPNLYDVLSRRGQRYNNSLGNSFCRELVVSLWYQHEKASRVEKHIIARIIIEKITRRGGKFLEWAPSKLLWVVTKDPKSMHSRIACSFREIKRGKRNITQNNIDASEINNTASKKEEFHGFSQEDDMNDPLNLSPQLMKRQKTCFCLGDPSSS